MLTQEEQILYLKSIVTEQQHVLDGLITSFADLTNHIRFANYQLDFISGILIIYSVLIITYILKNEKANCPFCNGNKTVKRIKWWFFDDSKV